MAAVQNVLVRVEGPMMNFTWEVIGEPIALSVQIANDIEFTRGLRTFVIPTGAGVGLDVGFGSWFFRVGSWFGTNKSGKILWTPVYGPAPVAVTKLAVATKAPTLPIIHSTPIVQGIRIHLGVTEKLYAVLEYSTEPRFTASKTKSIYEYDWGRGNVDIPDLDPDHTYSVRIATFTKDRSELPTDSVKQLEAFQGMHGKRPTRIARPVDSTARSIARASDTLLREMRDKPFKRFASHADYVRYMAAKTRSEEK